MSNQEKVSFSIAYFGDYPAEFSANKYQLLFESARFADKNLFTALWIPERHFHSFGGFSPNPAVIAAALARETQNIHLRAGSVVLPLHHPIRVAEDWSIIDNLSMGRVGIAFASGWHPNDFILAEKPFSERRDVTFNTIETVRKLWRGEVVTFTNGVGEEVAVSIFPRALQAELPCWTAVLGNPESYAKAGELGIGILTNLIGQSPDQLKNGIKIYRESLVKHGHDVSKAKVTVLLHTFLGQEAKQARELARLPLYQYLQSSIHLFQKIYGAQDSQDSWDGLSQDDKDYLFGKAYQRYIDSNALIGNTTTSLPIIENLYGMGVTEIACFIDFGMHPELVLQALPYIAELKNAVNQAPKVVIENNNETVIDITEDQQALWMLAQMRKEGSLAYHLRTTLRASGALNSDAMQQAVEYLMTRHEALRTTFSTDGAHQVIHQHMKMSVQQVDFSKIPEEKLQKILPEWFYQEENIAFDLRKGPLWRVALLKLNAHTFLLVVTIHHIICDGISKGILLDELGHVYSSLAIGRTLTLPAATQYRDFTIVRQEQLDEKNMQQHENFWKQHFADNIPTLNLPIDAPYPIFRTYKGRREKYEMPQHLWQRLMQASVQQKCTPFMFILSAWSLFLHKICSQKDIVVGVPAGNRSGITGSAMIGYGFNLLPIRTQYTAITTISDFITQVRRQLLDAFEHYEYPFARLLKLFDSHDWSRAPFVASSFNMDKLPIPKFDDITISYEPQPAHHVRFDISLNINETTDNILVYLEYNSDIFHPETIERFYQYFTNLLDTMLESPTTKVTALLLQQHKQADNTAASYLGMEDFNALEEPSSYIQDIFEEYAQSQPDLIAVKDEEQSLTYRELNSLSIALANKIIELGVREDSIIGIKIANCRHLLVAVLGVLKAGCAFVGFSDEIPQDRLQKICQDANVSLILTQNQYQASMQELGLPAILVENIVGNGESLKKSKIPYQANKLIYLVYTSGSTGIPKGVMVAHQQLNNYLRGIHRCVGFKQQAHYLFVSPINVDLGYTVLFSALLHGGCLHIMESKAYKNSANFISYCQQNHIDYLKITPMHFSALSYNQDLAKLCPRTAIIFGGEKLPAKMAKAVGEYCQVINHYGPAETTIGVIAQTVSANAIQDGDFVPAGKPLAAVQAYILDEWLQPVAQGLIGELFIGGGTVARGYCKQPELTQKAFIESPFRVSEKLYKTGDLAKFTNTGQIDVLGRADEQVKIRGYRVELDEVSTVISEFENVSQAIVVALGHQQEALNLIAYVVAKNISESAMMDFLRKKLPTYMLPDQIVFIDSMPLLPSGKINKKALPEPVNKSRSEVISTEPLNEVQSKLINIWQEILNINPINVTDDFFDLGGHSIHAIKLCSKILEIFNIQLPVSVLFEHSTPLDLANNIEQQYA